MKQLFLISLLFISLFSSAQTIKAKQVEDLFTQSNARTNSEYIINRMVNGKTTFPLATSIVGGIHEFDIHYDSAMVRGGLKGWYEMVYTRYSSGAYAGTRYVAFHNKSDLQANLASTTDISGKVVDNTYDKSVFGSDTLYPALVKEYDSIGPMYYVFGYGLGTSVTTVKKGRTIDEVIACQPKPVLFGYIDFSPSRSPTGGWIAGAFKISNPVDGQGVVLKAPSVEGPWEEESFLFDNTSREPAFKRQADGTLFTKGNQLFYLFQGINFENRISSESHAAIVELDRKSPYRIINQPTEIIHDLGTYGSANPVYLETPTSEEVWFARDSSIGYLTLSDDVRGTGRGLTDIVRVESGNKYEVTGNTPLYTYGTVTNTQIDGIKVSANNSGAWGFVNLTSLNQFEFKCRFKIDSLPAVKATVLKIVSDTSINQCSFSVEVNSSGVVSVKMVDSLGSVTSYTMSDVPIAPGSINNIYGINSNSQYAQFTLISDGTTSAVVTNPSPQLVGLNMFSLFNDKNLKNSLANQFKGTIYGVSLKKIFPFVSQAGLDDVVQTGNATTRAVTVGSITTPYVFANSGQYISMSGNTFSMVDNTNNTNTRLAVGGATLGTYYGSSISQGDIKTSGLGQFDSGIKTILTGDSTSKTKFVVWDDADNRFYWRSASGIGGGTTYTNGYGLNLISTTFSVDTLLVATRLRLQKVVDSLGAIIAGVSGSIPTPGGSDGSVQIKSGSSFVGYGNLLWNNTYGILSVNTTGVWNTTDALQVTGHGYYTGHVNADGYLNGSDLRIGGNIFAQVTSGELEINAGQYNPVSIYAGSVKMLKLNSNGAMLPGSTYLNFGSTSGTTGYGIRDNAGTMQFKHTGGSWTDFGSGGGSTTTNALTIGAELSPTGATTFNGSAAKTLAIQAGSVTNTMLANNSITIAGNSTALGGTVTQDNITGLSSTGIVKRTGANTLAIAAAGTDYQAPITLTTTGSSGAASFVAGTLNIPNYSVTSTSWNGGTNGTSYSATSATIDGNSLIWTFTGSSPATFTLPSYATFGNRVVLIKNIGSADLTITRAGTDQIYTTSAVTSFTLSAGKSVAITAAANGLTNTWETLFDPSTASSGVTGMAAIGSVPNANGASISGSTLTLQPADVSNGGVVINGTQTFGGNKTITGESTTTGYALNVLNSGATNLLKVSNNISTGIVGIGITPRSGYGINQLYGIYLGDNSTSGEVNQPYQTAPSTPTTGRGITYWKSDGKIYGKNDAGTEYDLTASAGGSGTVTSIDLTTPSWLTVSGSPVTTSGTLAVTATTGQTANRFLATPDGSTGAVSLRAIVAADIPTLNQNTTGSAAKFTTARNINGVAFDGTANITVPSDIAASTSGNVLTSNGTVWTSAANNGGWTTVRVSGSDATTTGQTLVDITGLASGTLTNSTKYEIEAVLDVSTSAVTTGTEYGIGAGGTGGAAVVSVILTGTTTGTSASSEGLSTTAGTASTARLLTSGQSGTIMLKGFVTTRGSGTATISVQHLKVTSGTSTVKIGSVFRYRLAQ